MALWCVSAPWGTRSVALEQSHSPPPTRSAPSPPPRATQMGDSLGAPLEFSGYNTREPNTVTELDNELFRGARHQQRPPPAGRPLPAPADDTVPPPSPLHQGSWAPDLIALASRQGSGPTTQACRCAFSTRSLCTTLPLSPWVRCWPGNSGVRPAVTSDPPPVAADLRLRFLAWWAAGYNNAFGYDRTSHSKGRSVGLGGNIGAVSRTRNSAPAGRRSTLNADDGRPPRSRLQTLSALPRLPPRPATARRLATAPSCGWRPSPFATRAPPTLRRRGKRPGRRARPPTKVGRRLAGGTLVAQANGGGSEADQALLEK